MNYTCVITIISRCNAIAPCHVAAAHPFISYIPSIPSIIRNKCPSAAQTLISLLRSRSCPSLSIINDIYFLARPGHYLHAHVHMRTYAMLWRVRTHQHAPIVSVTIYSVMLMNHAFITFIHFRYHCVVNLSEILHSQCAVNDAAATAIAPTAP